MISASSLAAFIDNSFLPSASTTQAQWWVLPTSIPTQALSRRVATCCSLLDPVANSSPWNTPLTHP
jgi:hypothetical protein